jgi:hypothetical protein
MKAIGLAAGDGRHDIFPFPKVGSVPTKDHARVHADAPARVARAHPGAAFPVPNAALFPNAGFMIFMEPADSISAAN